MPACSYDRAVNGCSDAGPSPRTSVRIVSELHELLGAAGERPPYILAGHSFGGYDVRLFANRYLDAVAGIVLVDSSHEEKDRLLGADPAFAAQWRAFLDGLRTCEHLARVRGRRRTGKTGRDCTRQFFRGLPERMF